MSQKLLPIIEDGRKIPDYFFDPKTEIIYFWKSISNKKVKFSTKTKLPNVQAARRFANGELKAKLGRGTLKIHSLIKDELGIWFKIKESEGLKPDTIKNIRNAIKQIKPFWGSMFPNEINASTLSIWYAWFKNEYPGQQMENAIKYMRTFCKYLSQTVMHGLPLLPAIPAIKDPDFKKVRRARKRKKSRVFTAVEFQIILSKCDETEKTIMLLMYTMALRVSEALSLRWDFLDLKSETYTFRDGDNKADHDGIQDIHSSLMPLLTARLKSSDSDWVFPQLTKDQPLKEQQIDWLGLRERAALGWHWTSHTCRHTCLSNLFNDERNPQALICKLYRVSIQTAMHTYIKVTPEGRRKMKNAISIDLKTPVAK